MTTTTPPEPTTAADVLAMFADLTNVLNELADVDWAELAADDDTPDHAATRVRSLSTLTAMLAQVTTASAEVTENLLTSMTLALIQATATDTP